MNGVVILVGLIVVATVYFFWNRQQSMSGELSSPEQLGGLYRRYPWWGSWWGGNPWWGRPYGRYPWRPYRHPWRYPGPIYV